MEFWTIFGHPIFWGGTLYFNDAAEFCLVDQKSRNRWILELRLPGGRAMKVTSVSSRSSVRSRSALPPTKTGLSQIQLIAPRGYLRCSTIEIVWPEVAVNV